MDKKTVDLLLDVIMCAETLQAQTKSSYGAYPVSCFLFTPGG